MRDTTRFRDAVRARRRAAGRTQQQLARAIGLHPDVLSHKINGSDSAVLTNQDVVAIVTALAAWGVLASRAEAEELLALMAVPPHVVSAQSWASPPLAALLAPRLPAPPAPRPEGYPGSAAPAAGRRGHGPEESRPSDGPDTVDETGAGTGGQGHRLTVAPLPAPATELIGRERELADVGGALASSRLVTLTGVGGTGKTRLALKAGGELAGRFRDGAAFVDLSAVSDPGLLATAITDSLGLAPPSAGVAAAHLTEALADKELLLILDNLEQLLDGAPLLTRLLAAAPAVRILATSRIALRLYGEHSLRVPPLALPGGQGQPRPAGAATYRDSAAVRLFVERARAVHPGFQPDDAELADIAASCAVLDGLPLAIELAASRVRLYPPKALLPLLQARLALLTSGPRDLPRRQQTLRAALDWSYELLPSAEQQLFACLGAFSGAFDAPAAAAVAGEGDPVAVLDRLADLADQSMLEVTRGETPRFHLLQTLREYALARLAEAGHSGQAQRRHLHYYLGVAEAAAATRAPDGRAAELGMLAAAYPNIRTALEFACTQAELAGAGAAGAACLEKGMRLAAAVCPLWRWRGPIAEGDLYLRRLLALDDDGGRPAAVRVRAATVTEASALACLSGGYQRAAALAREAIDLYESVGDHRGLAAAHRFLGEAFFSDGSYAAAGRQFDRSLAHAELAGDTRGEAAAANMAGQLHRHLGDYARSREQLRHAVRLFSGLGDTDAAAYCLHSLGETERDAGRLALARRLFSIALRHHHELGASRGIAYSLEGLATTAALAGRPDRALLYLGAARQVRDASGAPVPPVEQGALDRIIGQAVPGAAVREDHEAYRQGRAQPVAVTVATALGR